MYQSFYTGALGAGSCMAKMSVIANNLANINNDGYKPKTAVFSDLLNYNLNDSEEAVTNLMAGNGVRLQRTYTSYDVGAMTQTNSPLDYAIAEDNAFFMVQDPATGEITYTRSGSFHRGQWEDNYYLTTDNGKLVLDQNGEPLEAEVPDIEKLQAMLEEDYEPEEDDEDDEDDEDKPRISVYTFSNPSHLTSVGNNEYAAPEGMEPVLVERAKIVRMIECQRAYSYALKMVTTSDEIETTINSLRG